MPNPDLYAYEQSDPGRPRTFRSRWGDGPGKELKGAHAGDFYHVARRGLMGHELTIQLTFTTQRNDGLAPAWGQFLLLHKLEHVPSEFAFWPVSGSIWSNAPALLNEGDGMAWLVFLSRRGTRWAPMHLYTMWSDHQVVFRRWVPHHAHKSSEKLIGMEAFALAMQWPWVWKRDLPTT